MTLSAHPAFVHPVTGELVEATDETLAATIRDSYDELGRLYRALEPLEEEQRERQGAIRLPKTRYQTERQRTVAKCPRCRHEVAL